VLLGPVTLAAQTPAEADLVRRILTAEDRRDASDASLALGAAHPDARIRQLAERARGRIADPLFAARTALPAPTAPPAYADPAWRLRYRALGVRNVTCELVHAGLADSAWPVRFRAVAALTPACADTATLRTLTAWADALPPGAVARPAGGVSWHAGAHALVALARLAPREAIRRMPMFATHPVWHVRQYAVRAAAALGDSLRLRAAVADTHPNVRAAAITALAASTNPLDRGRFIAALPQSDVPTVLAAARALENAPEPAAREAAARAWAAWVARGTATERDVREALLAVTGQPASADRPPPIVTRISPTTVALALGAERQVRVTMAAASGGGSFTVRLRGDVAPIMAAEIVELARTGYYDGLSWHRVEHDFVIQGGSPGEDEYVGLPYFLRDELGLVPHVRGTVGMSTRGHDTGDAQWFVNLRDNLRLNREYTVFGEVIEGIDVVDGILEGDVIERIQPLVPH
jgi:cyclophilin family peptidyl-prolyl cis-trans isomerase